MLRHGVLYGLGLIGCCAIALLATRSRSDQQGVAPISTAQTCIASGAKHLAPPQSDAEACARIAAALATVPDITKVELRILPQGMLQVVVTRAGKPPVDFAEAVMDRAMTDADLDKLAANVAIGLRNPATR